MFRGDQQIERQDNGLSKYDGPICLISMKLQKRKEYKVVDSVRATMNAGSFPFCFRCNYTFLWKGNLCVSISK